MQWGETDALSLQASEWTVRLNGRTLVQDLDLAVPAMGCLAVLGESGSGKSSLLRLLSGAMADHPQLEQTGRVLYQGAPLTAQHAPALVKLSAKLLLAKTFDALLDVVRGQREHTRAEWAAFLTERLECWGFSELNAHWDDTVVSLSPLHQRVVAIARQALAQPPVLLIDDMCKGLNEYDCFLMLDFVRCLSADMAVIAALGQAREARHLRGHMVLLGRGAVVERGAIQDFMDDPTSAEGEAFLRESAVDLWVDLDDEDSLLPDTRAGQDTRASETWLGADPWRPDPVADSLQTQTPLIDMPSSLARQMPGEPLAWSQVKTLDAGHGCANAALPRPAQPVPANQGPRGFYWLLLGQLAGTPLPGLVGDLSHDLLALKQCHIRQLISLSPQSVDPELLAQHGICALHLAGTAGELPTPAQLRMLVRAMARMIERGQGVAVHCVSGNGRTGLLLAAYLMHQGLDVDAALAQVQASNPEFRLADPQRALLLATRNEVEPDCGMRRVA